MSDASALFETAIGRCAIAWRGNRLTAIRLPEHNDAATVAALKRSTGAARRAPPPAFVAEAITAIRAHLAGEPADLDALPLDLDRVEGFERQVLEACRRVPSGETTTYGTIAKALGNPQAARAVGAALGRNPWPIVVPCHRVLGADGKLGGFSAPGGRNAKRLLLEIEKAKMPGGAPDLFDKAIAS